MAKKQKIFSVEKAEDSSGFLLWQVTTLWQRQLNKMLKKKNLTHAQFVILASTCWLNLKYSSVTQIEISRHTKIEPMLASNIIKILERKNLLVREPSSVDTRAKIVKPTAQGINLAKSTVREVEDFDQKFFSTLVKKISTFNEELAQLIATNI